MYYIYGVLLLDGGNGPDKTDTRVQGQDSWSKSEHKKLDCACSDQRIMPLWKSIEYTRASGRLRLAGSQSLSP